jgi:hypothetical protein
MMATEKETIGNSNSPNISSGWRKPVIGPAIKPIVNKSKIDGKRRRQATHCAPTPRNNILARPTSASSAKETSSVVLLLQHLYEVKMQEIQL